MGGVTIRGTRFEFQSVGDELPRWSFGDCGRSIVIHHTAAGWVIYHWGLKGWERLTDEVYLDPNKAFNCAYEEDCEQWDRLDRAISHKC